MNNDEDPSATPGQGSPATDRVTAVLRRAGVVEHPPPPHVWDGVVSGVDHGRASAPVRLVGGPATGRRANARRTWSGSATRLLAAAAVGALVTWAGFELVGRETPAELLVSGELAALTGDGTEGHAEVVDVDGQQRLRVELAGRPNSGDGYLEVWLLRPDVSGMVTLGVLEGDTGEFLLPEGLDLAEYAVVDISREHLDGDPGHSGDSLVRGQVG